MKPFNPALGLGLSAVTGAYNYYNNYRNFTTLPVAPGTRTSVRMATNYDTAGYRQLRRGRKRSGRRLNRRTKVMKASEAQLLTKIDRFQFWSAISAGVGRYFIGSKYDDTNTVVHLPIYAFDLTALEHNLSGGVTLQSFPFMRLTRNYSTAGTYPSQYVWAPIYGYKNGDTFNATTHAITSTVYPENYKWQVERTPYSGLAAADSPYEKAYLDWADIRLQMVGAKSLPSVIEVMLVRFTDPSIVPSAYEYDGTNQRDRWPPPTPTTGTIGNEAAEYTKFWTAMLDRQIMSDAMVRHQGADTKSKMQVVQYKKFDFNPMIDTETDKSPHQCVYKHFHRMDGIYDYRMPVGAAPGAGSTPYIDSFNPEDLKDVDKGANAYPTIQASSSCSTFLRNPESRLFLLIRGLFYDKSGTAESTDTAPSFDLLVRRKITII